MLITVVFLHFCVSCHYQVSLIFLLNHIILFPRAASSNPIVPPCMFNCTIFPRGTCENDNGSERIHIFRCALQPVDYLYQKEIPSIKNHYVALCQSKSSSSTSQDLFFMKPLLPSVSFVLAAPADGREITGNDFSLVHSSLDPSNQDPVPSISAKKPVHTTAKGKLKQVLLDQMLTRKRKFEDESDEVPQQTDVTRKQETTKWLYTSGNYCRTIIFSYS